MAKEYEYSNGASYTVDGITFGIIAQGDTQSEADLTQLYINSLIEQDMGNTSNEK